ncbi:Conserved oligomeric Golgi complex subunit 2 [Irineochytrium annulatum]|nr:Conserved oligomeric Golgi complex subunit 2 [Irineochytrium annulatum]
MLSSLKNELIELINRDYADFINLSTNLVGVDKIINEISSPLEKVKADVSMGAQMVKTYLQSMVEALHMKLEGRATIRDKKAYLQLYLSIHESVGKLENLLNIAESRSGYNASMNGEMGLPDRGKLIEPVAIEYNQLQFLVSRGKDTQFVENIEWRINRIKETLTQTLAQSLRSSFNAVLMHPNNTSSISLLTQYLRTYVLIDKIKEAGMTIVASALESTTSSDPLADMYAKIINFIKVPCDRILTIAAKVFRDAQFDLLVDVLFADTVTAISKRLNVIFNPGIPNIFHKNYKTTIVFLTEFERCAKSRRSLLALRNYPSYQEFLKRWNLMVYFQIRLKEIVSVMEEAVASSTEVYGEPISDGVIGLADKSINADRERNDACHRLLFRYKDPKVNEGLSASLAAIEEYVPELWQRITSILVHRCVSSLEAKVKEIKSNALRSNQAPSAPSEYVSTILRPAIDFNEKYKAIDGPEVKELKLAIADSVTAKYYAYATDLLKLLSFQKGSKRRGGVKATTSSLSENTRLQLQLDVNLYRTQLSNYGIDAETLATFRELAASVQGAG